MTEKITDIVITAPATRSTDDMVFMLTYEQGDTTTIITGLTPESVITYGDTVDVVLKRGEQ